VWAYVSAFDIELDVLQGLMYVHAVFLCRELVHHLVAAVYQPLYSLVAVPCATSAYKAIVKVIHLQGAFFIIQNGLRFFCSGVLKGASCFLNPGSLQHRVAGATNKRIIFKHILPNAIGVIIVSVTLLLSGAILLETALSYIGFGVVPPDVSLGLLISQYQDSFTTRPWLFWYPGFFIISIALSINFIGDGLRDAFDPRQRRRISKKERQESATARKLAQAND